MEVDSKSQSESIKRSNSSETEKHVKRVKLINNDDNTIGTKFTETINESDSIEVKEAKNFQRLKTSRKVLILLAYKGTAYQGSQINNDAKTIEGTLWQAICKAEPPLVHSLNQLDIKRTKWSRACRTDKGVHAIGNIISCKLAIGNDYGDFQQIIKSISKHLPDDIQIIRIQRVMNGFSPKNHCSFRTYEYIIPSFAFAPYKIPQVSINNDITKKNYIDIQQDDQWLQFRADKNLIKSINLHLNSYVGTFNYHNFTKGRLGHDPSCKRYIKSFKIMETIVYQQVEFLRIRIYGASFMLHQIRKMIGAVIAHMRQDDNWCYKIDNTIDELSRYNLPTELFSASTRIRIPIAPALGLYLFKTHYPSYDTKTLKQAEHLRHPTVESAFQQTSQVIDQFIKEIIYPEIFQKELETKSCWKWLTQILNNCPFKWGEYLTEKDEQFGPKKAIELKKKYKSK